VLVFHKRKRKKKRNLGEVELNLTAMLDMAFQLLAFFVLTFKPAPVEGQISLHMPPAHPTTNINAGQKAGADENNKNPLQGLNTLTITVTGDRAGNIDKMYVGTASIANLAVLESQLQRQLGDPGTGFDQVIIQVGSTLQYQGLMQVVDVCTKIKMPDGSNLSKMSFVELPSGSGM
jgi:biopolymer transport protein ExbD